MDVRVKAKDGFIHGIYNLSRGAEAVMPKALADELSNLVEIQGDAPPPEKTAPVLENKMLGAVENKGNVPADGEAQPSSASPAAQASPTTTAKQSAAGAKKTGTKAAAK